MREATAIIKLKIYGSDWVYFADVATFIKNEVEKKWGKPVSVELILENHYDNANRT